MTDATLTELNRRIAAIRKQRKAETTPQPVRRFAFCSVRNNET
jgi:hypothetical protein